MIGNTQLPDFTMTRFTWNKQSFEYPPGLWDQYNALYKVPRSLTLNAHIRPGSVRFAELRKTLPT